MIVEEVVPTHFYDYGQNLYLNYLDAATKHVGGETLTDADKELVDEVEGIMVQKRQISRQGRLAFEIVFNKIKNLLRLYEKSEELDVKSQELLDVLYRTAIAEQGYCPVCARSLYKIIGRSS